jgi:hypothetical protein
MTQLAPKRVLNSNELAFIEISRKIRCGLVGGIEEIEQSVNGTLGPIAQELYRICPDGNEQDFWKSYDAMAKERKILQEWRNLIEVAPEPVAGKKECKYELHSLSYLKNRPKKQWGVDKLVYDRGSAIWAGDAGSGEATMTNADSHDSDQNSTLQFKKRQPFGQITTTL